MLASAMLLPDLSKMQQLLPVSLLQKCYFCTVLAVDAAFTTRGGFALLCRQP